MFCTTILAASSHVTQKFAQCLATHAACACAVFPTYVSPAVEGDAMMTAENGELAPTLSKRASASPDVRRAAGGA